MASATDVKEVVVTPLVKLKARGKAVLLSTIED
jgi:hypothetical protein